MVYTATTYDVKISVSSQFEHNLSIPEDKEFVFSYKIVIENLGDATVHLLKRHWFIVDSLGQNKEVVGEGVIGEKPVILPGETYEYSSWCQLSTDSGKMFGHYLMKVLSDNRMVEITIPEFLLLPAYRLN